MRNLNKPNRYNVASIQAQQTMGGDVMQADENGLFVEWRDYKWLLDSYAFVRDQWKDLDNENARLNADVYALMTNPTSRLLRAKQAENAVLAIENDSLKAEVERLRKAGDDLASSIQFNEEMEKDYDGPTIVHPSVERWNAAKEGKPSV